MTFVSSGLADPELGEVEAHIDRCFACRELVVHAAGRSPLGSTRRDGEALAVTGRPERIGRYEVLRAIGVGGMGVVYAARDPELGRVVALKLLRAAIPEASAQDHRARMAREAQAMARLAHPNVITVHDIGVQGDQLYIVMELVDGGTLAERYRAHDRRDWRKITALVLAAGRGLAAAHAAGIVHRDFKPENVLIGSNGAVRVTDFGLALLGRDTTPTATDAEAGPWSRDGVVIGTPAYMAPEQFRGEVADERADQFSFCASLWEALYGERPFAGATMVALEAAVCRGELRPRPPGSRVPAALHDAVARGLRPAAGDRWPSLAELLAAIERVATRRRVWPRWAAGAAAVLGVAVAVLALRRPHAWQAQIRELPVFEENGDAAAFSPDGTMIAYPSDREQTGVPRIYVSPLFGDAPRAVSPAGRTALHARWTRDGKAILFTDVQDHRAYRVAASGGPVELVAEPTRSIEDCGGRLVIQYDTSPGCEVCERLALRAPDGTERELVRFEPKERVGVPRCDRAGRRVLYSRLDNRSGSTNSYGTYDLWLLELDGGAPRRLTTDRADNVGTFAADGRSVVFSALHGQRHLWELALEPGATPSQLTFGAGWESAPDVSPDGKLVIFNIDITSVQLFAQPMSGGAARKLTSKVQSVEDAKPTPDGRAIVAQVVTPALAEWIVRIPFDGGDPVPLVEGRAPALTLDGRELVYTVAQTGHVRAIPIDGSAAARAITDAPGAVVDLNVGPDGRIHFSVAHGDHWEGWSALLVGGPAAREVPAPWTQLIPAPRGGWRVATRANPFICRFLPPGAALDDPAAREITADHEGEWLADGKSWLFVRESRVHRYFVETGEDRVVSEPNDYGPVAASSDGETLYTTQTIGRVRREIITNFADR